MLKIRPIFPMTYDVVIRWFDGRVMCQQIRTFNDRASAVLWSRLTQAVHRLRGRKVTVSIFTVEDVPELADLPSKDRSIEA